MSGEKKISDPTWWSNHILDNHYDENLTLEIFNSGKKICSISGSNPKFTLIVDCDDEKLDYSIQSCGLIDWYFDYTKRREPSDTSSIIASEGDVKKWMSERIQNNTVAIDTNILLNRVFSSLSLMNKDITSGLKFKIPRLTILELERKANDSKPFEKRKCFLAYGELLYLRSKGVKPMRELNPEILNGFSKISSDKKTDAWIRKEVKDEQNFIKPFAETVVLMTSDLVNSFSAIAEDIDTIYVHKILDHENKIREPSVEQIGRIITTLAVSYENISLEMNSESFKVDGMWEGKNIHDWVNEQVYHYPL